MVGVMISLRGWVAHFPLGRENTSNDNAAISGNRINDIPVISAARPIPPENITARNSANSLTKFSRRKNVFFILPVARADRHEALQVGHEAQRLVDVVEDRLGLRGGVLAVRNGNTWHLTVPL